MASQLNFELYDNSKLLKSISKDLNPSQLTDFLDTLDVFRQEVNNFLTNKISAIGVTDNTDEDESGSEEEVVEAVTPKKRKK